MSRTPFCIFFFPVMDESHSVYSQIGCMEVVHMRGRSPGHTPNEFSLENMNIFFSLKLFWCCWNVIDLHCLLFLPGSPQSRYSLSGVLPRLLIYFIWILVKYTPPCHLFHSMKLILIHGWANPGTRCCLAQAYVRELASCRPRFLRFSCMELFAWVFWERRLLKGEIYSSQPSGNPMEIICYWDGVIVEVECFPKVASHGGHSSQVA